VTSITHCPLNLGRNFIELYGALVAMQTIDKMHCYDWFFCAKKISNEIIKKQSDIMV
jgi:hypothetical protein